jgi:hypothetical protein
MEEMMSRLIKKLNAVRQPELRPMGFMLSSVSQDKSRIQIIASLKADFLEKAAESLASADAVLIEASTSADIKAAEKYCQAENSRPSGRRLKENDEKSAKKAQDSVCDFVVFNSAAPVSLIRNEKIGRILELDLNISEGMLRTASDLPVDSVLVQPQSEETPFTIQNLMLIQRAAYMVNKPILVCVSVGINQDELQSLWDMGICGVVIEVSNEKSAANLSEIRQMIDQLKPPAFRKKPKLTAVLPQSQTEKSEPVEDDDEEEEDE